MTKPEAVLLAYFLDVLADKQGSAGCNDFWVPNRDEYWDIVRFAEREKDQEPTRPPTRATIPCCDFSLVYHLKCRLMGEYGLLKADIEPVRRINQ